MKRARTNDQDNALEQSSRLKAEVDVHATTYSLSGLTYTECIKCGSDRYLLQDASWNTPLRHSRMGFWCLKCHVSYYDFGSIVGLRCSRAKQDGKECCAYLDKNFDCTKPSDHVESHFVILDLNHQRQKRVKISVHSRQACEAKEVPRCFDFDLLVNLRELLHTEHRQTAKYCNLGG